jgi:lipoprotein-anchoring transpeptidase ErfK/SrfK
VRPATTLPRFVHRENQPVKHALLVSIMAWLFVGIGSDAPARVGKDLDAELRARMGAADADPAQLPELIEFASAWIANAQDGAAAARVGDQLDPYLRRAFFTPLRFAGMERLGIVLHAVEPKQLPKAIAKKYRIDAHLLAALNDGYDDRKLKVGQQLKVLDLSDGSLDVVVDKPRFRMFVWRRAPSGANRLLLGVWPVGLGKESSATPTGQATVVKRVRDPEWTHPDTKKVHKHGDPDNVLGGFWIALDPIALGRTGIGLHGYTGKPATDWIEQKDSHGCVRMLQEHIMLLFDIALDGTKVTLREEYPPPTEYGGR